ATKMSAEDALQRSKENVIFNTATNYLSVLLNQELLKIAEENLEASKKQLEQVKAQVEVGMRPMVDLYNQESIVATNEYDIVNRENTYNMSVIQLLNILALDAVKEYEFITPGVDEDQLVMKNYSLAELIQSAHAN